MANWSLRFESMFDRPPNRIPINNLLNTVEGFLLMFLCSSFIARIPGVYEPIGSVGSHRCGATQWKPRGQRFGPGAQLKR